MILLPHLCILFLWLVCVCSPSEAQQLRGKAARQLGTLTPFTTELVVALYYVDDNLEEQFVEATRKTVGGNSSSLSAVHHFCKSVNKQATSHQVNVVALPLGVMVDTKISSTFSTDTECTVTRVQRVVPSDDTGDLIAPGSVVLQVILEQVVYITSSWEMSQEEVSDLVKHGFMRTNGGRTRFRSLLLQNPAFDNIVKVALLNDEPAWADPTEPLTSPILILSSQPSLTPSTSPSLSPFSPSFDKPISMDMPSFESTETIKDREGKKGMSHVGLIFIVMAILLVAIFTILFVYIFCIRKNEEARANSEETPTDELCIHDGASGQPKPGVVLRITNVVKESLVGNKWDPDVRVPCDPYESSLLDSSKAMKEPPPTTVAAALYKKALVIDHRKKDDNSDEDEEELVLSCSKARPRPSMSHQRIPKAALGEKLLRDYRAQERASKLSCEFAVMVPRVDSSAAEVTSAASVESTVHDDKNKHPEPSTLEVLPDDRAHEDASQLSSEEKPVAAVSTTAHVSFVVPLESPGAPEITPAVFVEPPLLLGIGKHSDLDDRCISSSVGDLCGNEQELNDVTEPTTSVMSLDDSNCDEVETIMMGEFPILPNSNSFDLRDDLEPVEEEAREEAAELTTNGHIWADTANEAAAITPLRRSKSASDGPLWCALWEARRLCEADVDLLDSMDCQESQPVLEKKMSQTDSRSVDFPPKGSAQKDVSSVELLASNSDASDVLIPECWSSFSLDQPKRRSTTCTEKETETLEPSLDEFGTFLLDDIESTTSIVFEDRDRANGLYSSDAMSLQSADSYRLEKRPDIRSKLHSRSFDHGIVPRWLDDELQRFDLTDNCCDSTDTTSISYASVSTRPSQQGNRQHRTFTVPPGKMGIVLANRSNGPGTYVSKVRPTSCLRGLLASGDKLVALDGEDVTSLTVSEVTALITARFDNERTLIVLRKTDRIEKRVV